MSVYLPIANISVSLLLILGLGGMVGFLSGLFGIGGGFLLTPLLMLIGVPSAVAVASDSNQIVAAATSGAVAQQRAGHVDFKLGFILALGGIMGGQLGVQLVSLLRAIGNFDFVVKSVYIIMLGSIGAFMLKESIETHRGQRAEPKPNPKSTLFYFIAQLPLQTVFRVAGVRTSLIFPLVLGGFIGIMTAIMGVGGGFIIVPALIYLIGCRTSVAIGTSLFQIVFTSIYVTFQQASINHTVDLVLALCLMIGSSLGAQVGVRLGHKLKGHQLRFIMALLVLGVMVKLFIDVTTQPLALVNLAASQGGH